MRKIYFLIAFSFLPSAAVAQNLNPTVEVSRSYEGKLVEVHKTDTEVFVPDSLTNFDYSVDYSVFDNPYKGSYEFHPYIIEMKPERESYDGSVFYFDAGCQYSLAPSGHLVFSPAFKSGNFGLSLWGNCDSYYGKMQAFDSEYDASYLNAEGGLSGSLDAKTLRINFDLGYKRLNNDDLFSFHNYGRVFASLAFSTPTGTKKGFVFDFKADVESGKDELFKETAVDIDGFVGIPIGRLKKGKVGVSVGGSFVGGSSFDYDKTFSVYAAPQFSLQGRRGRAVLGAKISLPFVISPYVKADFFLVEKYLDAYAEADGGVSLNSYSSLVGVNPFYCADMIDNISATRQRLKAKAGFRGIGGSSFSYDLFAGYSILDNSVCESYALSTYFLSFQDCKVFTAGGRMGWQSDRMDLTANILYSSSNLDETVFSLPKLQTSFKAEYNWNRRVFARVGLDWRSERTSMFLDCPSWIDLGLGAEYRINKWLSVYLKAGNLLNQDIQRYLFHARKGVNFGGGLCVNLRKNA